MHMPAALSPLRSLIWAARSLNREIMIDPLPTVFSRPTKRENDRVACLERLIVLLYGRSVCLRACLHRGLRSILAPSKHFSFFQIFEK
jgi:hypothetical protein